jgi:hypothetical protein
MCGVVVAIEQRVGALVSILTVGSLLRKGIEQAIISSTKPYVKVESSRRSRRLVEMNTEEMESGLGQATANDDRQSTEGQSSTKVQESTRSLKERSYTASLYPGQASTIPNKLADAILRLEEIFSRESEVTTHVWLLVQGGKGEDKARTEEYGDINEKVRRKFFSERAHLSQDAQVVVLIDSLGGSAKSAYQLAKFFRNYSHRFVAMVPRTAKSAATLLALGADEIILGNAGELGPVDAQVRERNEFVTVLDTVKTLERMHASALEAVDRTMALLTLRSGEDVDKLLPLALDFAAQLSQPYLRDTSLVEYTRMSRVLKIGEDYASRLLEIQLNEQESKQASAYSGAQRDNQPNSQVSDRVTDTVPGENELFSDYSLRSKRNARLIAQHLAGAYPDHSFAIDGEEARRIGLRQVHQPSESLSPIVDEIHELIADRVQEGLTVIGRVMEINDE